MKRLSSILQDYVAGDLGEAQRRKIEQRIEKEPRVRELYEEIRDAHEALTSLRDRPEPPVSADDALPRIQAAITANRYEDRPALYMDGSGRRYYKRIAMAATVMLAVTVGLLVWNNQGGAENPVPEPAPAFSGIDARPSAAERDLVSITGTHPEIDAATVLEMLEKVGKLAIEFTPNDGVLPVSDGLTDNR